MRRAHTGPRARRDRANPSRSARRVNLIERSEIDSKSEAVSLARTPSTGPCPGATRCPSSRNPSSPVRFFRTSSTRQPNQPIAHVDHMRTTSIPSSYRSFTNHLHINASSGSIRSVATGNKGPVTTDPLCGRHMHLGRDADFPALRGEHVSAISSGAFHVRQSLRALGSARGDRVRGRGQTTAPSPQSCDGEASARYSAGR